jgi:hypothetical protein
VYRFVSSYLQSASGCFVFIDNNVSCMIQNINLYEWYSNIIYDVYYLIDYHVI